jgi:hypothetical protein
MGLLLKVLLAIVLLGIYNLSCAYFYLVSFSKRTKKIIMIIGNIVIISSIIFLYYINN